jgi:hypothetical protein
MEAERLNIVAFTKYSNSARSTFRNVATVMGTNIMQYTLD